MKPVSPVISGYESHEVVLAEDQPEYEPLPVLVLDTAERQMLSRWVLSDEEREKIARGGSIILTQLTFGHRFQPVSVEVSE